MNNKKKAILEVLRYIFSISAFKSYVYSFAYYIHEHVSWRKEINARPNIRVHSTASIRNAKNIYIGENSHININCCVWAGEESKIIIGDNLLMGPGVSIQADNHGTFKDEIMMQQERVQKDIVIGNDCWLCSNVTVTSGVHIADGCIIAAGAVVTKNITEPYSIVLLSKGKYVALLHDDDVLLDNYYLTIRKYIFGNKSYPCLVPSYYEFEDKFVLGWKFRLVRTLFFFRYFYRKELKRIQPKDYIYSLRDVFNAPTCGALFLRDDLI